jgi:DNA-binding FadR family transcriptional regulator
VPKGAEIIAGRLRRSIIREELPAGTMLPPEPVLMEQFGVSRATLREALRILESEQLISIRRGPRGGAMVNSPSPEAAARFAGAVLAYRGATVAHVFMAKAAVESQAVWELAQAGDAEVVEILSKVHERASADATWAETSGAFRELHNLVVELTGNETLVFLAEILRWIVAKAADQAVAWHAAHGNDLREDIAHSHAAHARLIELIRDRKPEDAFVHWHRHLIAGGQRVLHGPGATTVLDLPE